MTRATDIVCVFRIQFAGTRREVGPFLLAAFVFPAAMYLFAKAIVITAFLPIFTFQRVEKRIFSPMAYTLSFALVGSLLLSLTLIPVLASFWLKSTSAEEPTAARWLRRRFKPLLDRALAHSRVVLMVAGALLLAALVIGSRLGTEFLPALDEGNIWLTVSMPVGISLEAARLTAAIASSMPAGRSPPMRRSNSSRSAWASWRFAQLR